MRIGPENLSKVKGIVKDATLHNLMWQWLTIHFQKWEQVRIYFPCKSDHQFSKSWHWYKLRTSPDILSKVKVTAQRSMIKNAYMRPVLQSYWVVNYYACFQKADINTKLRCSNLLMSRSQHQDQKSMMLKDSVCCTTLW